MIEKLNEKNSLKFQTLSEDEKKSRGILGRLYGKVADFINSTRNGRKYPLSLWEKLFNSDLIKERFANGGIFGQLCHPDYEEVDMEKVAVVMPEPPVKDSDGQLVAYLDIVDTPCGRIAYQLAKYGYKFGVSSRGSGDIVTDWDGNESVDPNTYTLTAFDLVEIPAVKSARMTFTESLDLKKDDSGKTLNENLNELVNSANEDDRKIMVEALDSLKIDYKEKEKQQENIVNNNCDNHQETDVYIDEEQEDSSAVDNSEAKVLSDLQEALAKINTLEHEKLSLNEKLSVCYAKEDELKERYINAKKSVIKLTESLKKEKANAVNLENNVSKLQESLSNSEKSNSLMEKKISTLKEELQKIDKSKKLLSESVSKETEKIRNLRESMSNMESSFNSERQKLNEEIASLRKDCELVKGNYSKKLDKSNKLVEKYKSIANSAIDKYIDSKADMYGISRDDIRTKLGESYTFEDIENACSTLREYKVNMNKLPFNFSKSLNESSRIKVNQKESMKQFSNSDDELDSQLIALSGLE